MDKSKTARGFGFRDLTLFNKALLAKQCWRLIQHLDSLTTQILKAKYFPHSSFMEYSLGNRLPFAWCIIFSTKELV
jgi:hypothetical protein